MAMSQCTTFVLADGKEEIKVFWDLSNGEFSIQRIKFPEFMNKKEKEESLDVCKNKNCPNLKHTKHSFFFRANELDTRESMELAQVIQRALFMLLGLKNQEDVENAIGLYFSNEEEEEDFDEDDF